MRRDEIVVSVCMITYNHEKYISEAIKGVLMQKTNFSIEFIISEDCSTDNTRKIVVEYANKYPEKIRPILPEKNLGMMKNFFETMQAASGKYIAICEGDDYWIDPLKLQKQVDFLEENPDCSICFHASKHVQAKNPEKYYIYHPTNMPMDNKYEIKHAILGGGGFMATNSMVFLQKYILKRPEWIEHAPVGDIPLMLLLATNGKIGYIDDVMSVYRLMSSSTSWSFTMNDPVKRKNHYLAILKMWNDFDRWTNQKYHKYVVRKKNINKWNHSKGSIISLIKKLINK